jgi:TPR repeat protein
MYRNGDGIRQNKKIAVSLYKKACDGGDASGCYNLGNTYNNGDGIRQNKKIAKELFGKACDGGLNKGYKNYKILNEKGV